MRKKGAISAAIDLQVPFFDVDMMQIVWHGHYVKYLEQARCALFERFDYGYAKMVESGYGWPIIDIQLRYVQGATCGQMIRVQADLVEWQNRVKVNYLITDLANGTRLTRATSTQVAVDMHTREMLFASPAALTDRIDHLLATLPKQDTE